MSILNTEPEETIIGLILLDATNNAPLALSLLEPNDFEDPFCYSVFCAVKQCVEANMTPDIVSVSSCLLESGEPLPVNWRAMLMEYTSLVFAGGFDVETHASILRARRVKVDLRFLGQQLQTSAETTSFFNLDEVVASAQKQLNDISGRLVSTDDAKSSGEIGQQLIAETEIRMANPQHYTGLRTGFTDLDHLTLGWKKDELIIIAARPSMGKSAFMLAAVKAAVIDHQKPCLIFSLEMGRSQLMQRLVANVATIDSTRIAKGILTQEEFQRVVQATRTLAAAPLYIQDNIRMTPTGLRTVARRLSERLGGLGLICVDYLQILQSGLKANGNNRVEEVSYLSRELKAMAREFSVPVIALSQLSRAVESRNDKRPMLSDLRESGSIEQDADIVAFLYRDDYYNPQSTQAGIAEINIAKNREGPCGRCELLWRPEYSQFLNRPNPTPLYQDPYGGP